MSRCFQYPPPGYTLSRAHYEALIESIKLRKEKERKKEKKQKRKERKEKRKAKKEKKERKEREKVKKDDTNQNSGESDIVKRHFSQKRITDTKSEFLQKKREAETEQAERSSLTEEHAGPASASVPSSSSDSTQNCNKRKRHSSPVDDTYAHGKVTLIRFSSKKQNEFDALADVQQQQPCSTSGRSVSAAKRRNVSCVRDWPEKLLKGTSGINQRFDLRSNGEQQICSTSGQVEAGKTGTKCTAKEILSEMRKMEFLQYESLLEKCITPQIQDLFIYRGDSDWLLQGGNLEKKRSFGGDGLSCARSAGLWPPRAEYLRQVDAYALPFTVPY